MEVRRANPEEASHLKQLAIAAKGYWGYSSDWMATWGSRLTLPPQYILDNEVYVATDGLETIGFYALICKGYICELDHLWVAPARIGTGIGRTLFSHALQRATALGAEHMELEADPHAVGFYQRMGARYVRDTITELEGPLPIMEIGIDSYTASLDAPTAQ